MKLYLFRRFFLFSLLFSLFACNSTVESISVDSEVITANEIRKGYLLIGVETNISLKSIDIDGPQDIALSTSDLRRGTNFILVPLEAGTYEVENVSTLYYTRFDLEDDEKWQFQIKPQVISYVGHLEFKVSGFFSRYSSMELVNRSTEALDFLEQKFPNILDNRKLYYGGPGEDEFFDFVENLGE